MLLLEYWKVCPRFPNYEVSFSQRVRHITGKKVKNSYTSDGYFKMNVDYLGKKHKPYLHQMVGWTFVPNPESKPELHHIDGDSYNNHPSNFEWVTRKEHVRKSKDLGQLKTKLKVEDVIFIRQNYWLCDDTFLSEKYQVAIPTIQGVATGRLWPDVNCPVHHTEIGTSNLIIDIAYGIFYEDAEEVSSLTGYTVKNIRRWLSGERPNRTTYRYADRKEIRVTVIATPKRSKKMKPIAKFDDKGNLVERFLDIKNVGNRILRQRIGAFLEGRCKPIDGFLYKLISKDGSFIEPPKFVSIKKKRIPSLIPPTPSKEVIKYTEQGDFVQRFASTRDAIKHCGADRANFSKLIKGKRTGRPGYYKGFIYRYAE